MVSKFIDFNNKKVTKFYDNIQYVTINIDYDDYYDKSVISLIEYMRNKVNESLKEVNAKNPVYFIMNFNTHMENIDKEAMFNLGFSVFTDEITTEDSKNDYLFIPLYMKNKVYGNVGTLRRLGNLVTKLDKIQFIASFNGQIFRKAVN